jgi:hypothetical protein
LHLEKSAYQFMELVTQNFAQHIELARSVFASRTKAEFDNLRNALDSQIRTVYALAQYSEGIRTGAKKLFITHNSDVTNLKEQLARANDWSAQAIHLNDDH